MNDQLIRTVRFYLSTDADTGSLAIFKSVQWPFPWLPRKGDLVHNYLSSSGAAPPEFECDEVEDIEFFGGCVEITIQTSFPEFILQCLRQYNWCINEAAEASEEVTELAIDKFIREVTQVMQRRGDAPDIVARVLSELEAARK